MKRSELQLINGVDEIRKIPAKKPPSITRESAQMDLFTRFTANNLNQVSNSIELWDSIPKYFFTPKQMEKLRTLEGHADPYTRKYEYKEVNYIVKFQPALIEQPNGGYKAFFPGNTEDLVEEALKKILSKQSYGIHDPQKKETWVRFTLGMIQKDLKSRGKERNIKEIKHAIKVMSSCVLTWGFDDDIEIWNGAILQDLVTVGRKEYLADLDAHHVARLPIFITTAINDLDYRQFNYDRLMGCNAQLSRWIYKLLINRFIQAGGINPYNFLYSDLKNSGLLQQGRECDNRKKVISAFEELKARNVVLELKQEERKNKGKIIDVKYTVIATLAFTSEQKAANLRKRDGGLHKNK